jgi:hypothetical protein
MLVEGLFEELMHLEVRKWSHFYFERQRRMAIEAALV